ncbi:Mut7-C RNAse domain-containing protein [Natronosalvus halobius]|uniref:Mut7-C RNAse domain-containing protein n=1 Tax=Natronosalvus halobius TaxID=2953746 RepID=UPI0028804E8A|nr:Mut7-C RNAse domain-containing protein [Natronosalvus halobius]
MVTYCRMCGHDTVYAGDCDLEAGDGLLDVAADEGRTIVTRDVDLAARSERAILLESRDTDEQLRTLHDRGLDLTLPDEPRRCGRCNGPLEHVSEAETGTADTPPYAPEPSEMAVWACRNCGQHFWKGSHWDSVRRRLGPVRSEKSSGERDSAGDENSPTEYQNDSAGNEYGSDQ